MSFPNPGNYGTDPGDFSGRDYALGRYYYGDGDGSGEGGGDGPTGPGCAGCTGIALAIIVVLWLVLEAISCVAGLR